MFRLGTESNQHLPAVRQGFALRDIVAVLYRRRLIILAISLPIIVAGGLNLFRQAGAYTASSRVLVELRRVDQPQWDTSQYLDYDRELSTMFNIAMSVPVAEIAAEALVDSIPIIRTIDPVLLDLENVVQLRDYLLGGLDVNTVGESTILDFRFTAIKPRMAIMATTALRDAFIDFQNFGKQKPAAIAFYHEQMASVRAEIDSLLEVRGEVLVAAGYSSLADELRYDSGQIADTRTDLIDVQAELVTLRQRRTTLLEFMDRDPREFPIGKHESRAEPLVYLRNLVLKHEDDLHSILSVHTESSLPAQRQLALLERSLARMREEQRSYIESIEVSIKVQSEQEAFLQAKLTEMRNQSKRGPIAYQRVSLLDVEINSLKSLMEDLQTKWGEVRMNQMADERVSGVIALADSELVSVLSRGKTFVYFAVLIVMAIALGIIVAFILEGFDHRIYVPRDVEQNLMIPVLASVTEVE